MIVPLESILPEIPAIRTRYVAGLNDDDGEPNYSVLVLTEQYDPANGESRGLLAVATVIPSMTDEQVRHLSTQLARATGLAAEQDLAIAILKANLQEAQDGLRAITQMLEHGDAE